MSRKNRGLLWKIIKVNERDVSAIIDSDCTRSILSEKIGKGKGIKSKIIGFNGKEEWSKGNIIVNVEINGKSKRLELMVKKKLLENADMILGLEIIENFGGIRIESGRVEFLVDVERKNEKKEKFKRKSVDLINKKKNR